MQVIVKKTYQVPKEEVFVNVIKIEEDYDSSNAVEITYIDIDEDIYSESIRIDGYTELVVRL